MARLNNINSASLNREETKALMKDLLDCDNGFSGLTGTPTPVGTKEELFKAVKNNTGRANNEKL